MRKGPLSSLKNRNKQRKPCTPKQGALKKRRIHETGRKVVKRTKKLSRKSQISKFLKTPPTIELSQAGKVVLKEKRFFAWEDDEFVIDVLKRRGWHYLGEPVKDGREDYPDPIIEARQKKQVDIAGALYWADDDDARFLAGVSPHHLFSSIPNTEQCLTKIEQAKMFNHYPWFPNCFILPKSRQDLIQYAGKNPNAYFICKPKDSYGGVGMRVYKAGSEAFINMSNRTSLFVVQEYMPIPYLFAGLYKFHLRGYMVITCLRPCKAYLWKNGQVQFSTHKFDLEQIEDNFNKYCHITNYKVQNEKKNVIKACEDKPGIGIGTEWGFERFFCYMEAHEPLFSREKFWKDVEAMARQVAKGMAQNKKTQKLKHESYKSSHFEIFGLDILMNNQCEIALTEANTQPGLDATNPTMPNGVYNSEAVIANEITAGIVCDTLTLVGAETGPCYSPFIPL